MRTVHSMPVPIASPVTEENNLINKELCEWSVTSFTEQDSANCSQQNEIIQPQ
jgi:hypothetical protein